MEVLKSQTVSNKFHVAVIVWSTTVAVLSDVNFIANKVILNKRSDIEHITTCIWNGVAAQPFARVPWWKEVIRNENGGGEEGGL
jgi:hypothetical protein